MLIKKSPPFVTLLLLISFGAVSAVLFTPALPQIKNYFGISQVLAELTVSLFLAGYAIGQLPYGAISNRFGRKPALFFAIALTIVGTILCIFSANLNCFPLLFISHFFRNSILYKQSKYFRSTYIKVC
jgi:DHA1 family bicyclomycin/chloramphenicol resistance-like MFS transporter